MSGFLLYSGKSKLNGKKIVAVAITRSANKKTGNVLQTHILVDNEKKPQENIKGEDKAICGQCPLRGNGCYVRVEQAPNQVYKTWQAGNYKIPDEKIIEKIKGRTLRLGSYGDPCALSFELWKNLIGLIGGKYVGYTHQWKQKRFQRFRELCMASVATEREKREANALGWRTFRTKRADEQKLVDEIVCPASEEGGYKSTCDKCGLCNGVNEKSVKKNIVINVHGLPHKQEKFKKIQLKLL